MSIIYGRGQLKVEVHLILTEEEAAALSAMISYGADKFLEVFYDKLGRAYMQPVENGLRSLFGTIQAGQIGAILKRAEEAREVFNGLKEAREPEKRV